MTPSEAIAEMLDAVRAERAAVAQSLGALGGQPTVALTAGQRVAREPGAHAYRFECELELLVADGTRVQIHAPGAAASGEVLDHDVGLGILEVVVREDLGDEVPQAALAFDSTYLLDRLASRLQSLAQEASAADAGGAPREEGPNLGLALAFLEGSAAPGPAATLARPGLSDSQRRALSFVLGQRVAYLWGPPGTGKTRTVGRLVHELIGRGERVLLTAHTNIATDNALARVLDDAPLAPGAAVRVGYPSESLRGRGVALDEVADRAIRSARPDLARGIAEACERALPFARGLPRALASDKAPLGRRLRMARESCQGEQVQDLTLPPLLNELQRELDEVEKGCLERASVVAATLTRVYLDRRLVRLTSDALVVDEASIASLALSFVAACGARRRAIAVGDFMQLPAIVQAGQPSARKWLGRHVFSSAGCDRPDLDHPLRAMLEEQWRMHPGISAMVSRLFYAGRLKDAPALAARARPGPSALLLDTGRLSPRSEASGSGSKRNPAHARLVARLVELAAGQEVAVIAPYRAQVRALRDAIRASQPHRLRSGQVEVFTVHRFQGRDRQLVVFDLVDAPGTPSQFLDEVRNRDAINLINVALSRARERLVIAGHLAHLANVVGRFGLVNQVFALLRASGGLELEAGLESDEAALKRFLAGERIPA